jgi:hypothetical protein
MWLQWLRNLTSIQMTDFISERELSFQSNPFSLSFSNLWISSLNQYFYNFVILWCHILTFKITFPASRPKYQKKGTSHSSELSVGGSLAKFSSVHVEAPAMLVPSFAHSKSVRETVQEVKMVQVLFFWCSCTLPFAWNCYVSN